MLMNMNLAQLLHLLERTADILDILAEDEYRSRAYRQAARSLDSYSELQPLIDQQFVGIPKVGKGIAAELLHYVKTGQFAPLEIEKKLPAGVLELLSVRGLGPKRIHALWNAGIDSPEMLQAWAQDGRLAALRGFGVKTAAMIRNNVQVTLDARGKQHLSVAQQRIIPILTELQDFQPRVAGELRRHLEIISQMVLTVTGAVDQVAACLASYQPETIGQTICIQHEGYFIRIECASSENRGLVDAKQTPCAELDSFHDHGSFPTEQTVWDSIGIAMRPAEYREPEHDELWQTLPMPELSAAHIRGMLHTHSYWSDGQASIAEMARHVQELGHDYLGTADHSQSSHYANGLSINNLYKQLAEIRELQRAGLPIVAGTEVDILPDGTLDYPDELLSELDYVVASVHTAFELDQQAQTERIIRAVEHPLVTILGHPTGRLLLRRSPYALDIDAVLAACERTRTAVEINANPKRLDLDWRLALPWRDRLYWAINTDAHSLQGLEQLNYGVMMARKAGITLDRVINTQDQHTFLHWAKSKPKDVI